MIRWFADLPIERKLRVVITVPAMAVFAIAMIVHIATNLLHLRDDLQWCAARIARINGASTIEALRLGDDKAALEAMSGLRDEWLVSAAEVFLPNGQKLATYRRAQDDVRLDGATTLDRTTTQSPAATLPPASRFDPAQPAAAAADSGTDRRMGAAAAPRQRGVDARSG